jgi:hypothetical protein
MGMNRIQNYRCTTCFKLADEELCGSPCRQCEADAASGKAAADAAAYWREQDEDEAFAETDSRDHLDRFGREFSADELVGGGR